MRQPSAIRANADLLAGIVLLAITAVAFWGAQGGGPSVWLFPRLAAGVVGLCGLLLVTGGVQRKAAGVVWEDVRQARDVALFLAAAVVYAVLLRWAGFWLTSGLLVGGSAYALGRKRPWQLAAWLVGGVALALAMDALFVGAFGVPLPGGELWDGARWRPWVP